MNKEDLDLYCQKLVTFKFLSKVGSRLPGTIYSRLVCSLCGEEFEYMTDPALHCLKEHANADIPRLAALAEEEEERIEAGRKKFERFLELSWRTYPDRFCHYCKACDQQWKFKGEMYDTWSEAREHFFKVHHDDELYE